MSAPTPYFQMERETRDEARSFEDALDWEQAGVEPELERWIADHAYGPLPLFGRSYVARGRYADNLERWLALFPREQLRADERRAARRAGQRCPRWSGSRIAQWQPRATRRRTFARTRRCRRPRATGCVPCSTSTGGSSGCSISSSPELGPNRTLSMRARRFCRGLLPRVRNEDRQVSGIGR